MEASAEIIIFPVRIVNTLHGQGSRGIVMAMEIIIDDIKKILEAAVHAPSGDNAQS